MELSSGRHFCLPTKAILQKWLPLLQFDLATSLHLDFIQVDSTPASLDPLYLSSKPHTIG